MLIIFDLDDTLVDTSGCITPFQLRAAFDKMIEQGLQVPDPEKALDLLLKIDETAESASAALSEFLEIVDGDPNLFFTAASIVYGDLPEDMTVFPMDDALEVLLELKEKHELALVSCGKKDRQMLKMKKAGIDSTLFSKIIISEDRDKKPHYQTILEELQYSPLHTVVCGDRLALDLKPAKELGCKTVQMRWGRGLSHRAAAAKEADFAIRALRQLKEVITLL